MMIQPNEHKKVGEASQKLARIPSGAPASAIVEAIQPCVPRSVGLLNVVRPSAIEALVSQPAGIPSKVLEGWLLSPKAALASALLPLLLSSPGKLWRDSMTVRGAQREALDVLRVLDNEGLGEGIGYKLIVRPSLFYGEEHIMLALILERHAAISDRTEVLLNAIHAPLRDAVLRRSLPLIAHQSILSQIIEEQSLGYICLSSAGAVREANWRARALVERYRDRAGITGSRGALETFATRARCEARGGQPWLLNAHDARSTLLVDVSSLAKETHVLSEDLHMIVMRELLHERAAGAELSSLTEREQEVCLLLARTALDQKHIADKLAISRGTVRKHVENIYRKLCVTSRQELTARVNGLS